MYWVSAARKPLSTRVATSPGSWGDIWGSCAETRLMFLRGASRCQHDGAPACMLIQPSRPLAWVMPARAAI